MSSIWKEGLTWRSSETFTSCWKRRVRVYCWQRNTRHQLESVQIQHQWILVRLKCETRCLRQLVYSCKERALNTNPLNHGVSGFWGAKAQRDESSKWRRSTTFTKLVGMWMTPISIESYTTTIVMNTENSGDCLGHGNMFLLVLILYGIL